MRKKHIRFFISSTFRDMEWERNLLQELFVDIERKYAKDGWQIENIDLRWGVSEEAGLDNKTMQICIEELKRCQELSPKPNFIILLGDRYGWVPLPEIVPATQYKLLQMTDTEKKIFNDWYQFDSNGLPEGNYVLKSRKDYNDKKMESVGGSVEILDYTDKRCWENNIEKPLGKMFIRNHCNLYGKSATEQEIELGALGVDDASDHVVAYIRKITNAPTDNSDFNEEEATSREKISKLRDRIIEKLPPEHIVCVTSDFNQYKTEQYKKDFVTEIRKKLEIIINKTIKECENTVTISENQKHKAFAFDYACHFIGREKELNEIDIYLHNSSAQYGLWYLAPSGYGKSALLAKIVDKYNYEFDIVCRFCGISYESTDPQLLCESLYDDISIFDTCQKQDRQSNHDKRFDLGRLHTLLRKIKLQRTLLIVLDSLDRVNDCQMKEFNLLYWLNIQQRNDIRLIISTTPEDKYKIERSFLKKLSLPNLGNDSMQLLLLQIANSKRRLTEKQISQVEAIVNKSDKSPLFLTILGLLLSRIPSWDDLGNIPFELEKLVYDYVSKLELPQKHGCLLVRLILNWLTLDDYGLSDREINDLLALDEDYISSLERYHLLNRVNGKVQIPSVIWIRLRHSLQPLLRQVHTDAGVLTTFFHFKIRQCIKNMYCDSYEQTIRMSDYYISHYPEKHALLMGCRLLCKAYSEGKKSEEMLLFHMKSNPDYVINKLVSFPFQLMEDYDQVINLLKGTEEAKVLLKIKILLFNIRNYKRREEIEMALRNMPSYMSLRQNIKSDKYMEDILSYNPFVETTIIPINDLGLCPCMSQDGKTVASLTDNGFRLKIDRIDMTFQARTYPLIYPAKEILCDDNVRFVAIRYDHSIQLFDSIANKSIFADNIENDGWISLSYDGSMLLYGSPSTKEATLYWVQNNTKIKFQNIQHARLSPSGGYIWGIDSETTCLFRISTSDYQEISFCKLHDKYSDNYNTPKISSSKSKYKIISCSDECCMVNGHVIVHKAGLNVKNLIVSFSMFYGDSDSTSLYVHRYRPMWIEPSGICSEIDGNGNRIICGTIPIDNITCLNGDFTMALSARESRVFDFRKELQSFRSLKSELGFGTIICLSHSKNAHQIVVSSCGGQYSSHCTAATLLRINHKKCYLWTPDIKMDTYSCLPQNVISPDGSLMAVSAYPNGDLYLVNTNNDQILWNLKLPIEQSGGTHDNNVQYMQFSEDGNYLAVKSGDILNDAGEPVSNIYIFDRSGNIVFYLHDDKEELHWLAPFIITRNNQYLIIGGKVFDLINNQFVVNDEVFILQSPSTLDIYTNKHHINLLTLQAEEIVTNIDYDIVKISPSGRFRYYIRQNVLYVHTGDNNQKIKSNIKDVILTLDDVHIYIIDLDNHIILYDIKHHKDLQYAFNGLGPTHFSLCSQGLVSFNDETSKLSLFSPNIRYHVNQPAVTTFIRRWRLEDKTQYRHPTAICPVCGNIIQYNSQNHFALKEYDSHNVKYTDWDNPDLFGHQCPFCRSFLYFTPYIL